MNTLKISLITICYNASATIQKCIDSVLNQQYAAVEYIVIDGNSMDGTQEIILENISGIHYFKSEPDAGIYDAMNKGLLQATGDIVGMLNADDFLYNDQVLSDIVFAFEHESPEILYADLDYVEHNGRVVRRWRSGNYRPEKFNWGWMPPHPTFYAKRKLFIEFGFYNMDYGTAGDYELMLRFMYRENIKVCYLNKVIVNMGSGGVSNQNFRNRLAAWRHDFDAMSCHHIRLPWLAIVLKPLRKAFQFIT